jgi:DNA repair protein RadC
MGEKIRTTSDVHMLFAHLAAQPLEVCAFAYLDDEGRILGTRHSQGNVASLIVPLRAVARDAVALGAARVVMAHNHPSGDPRPSDADIRVTRRLARALDALDAPLVEHLIVTPGGSTSLSAAGVI